MGILKAGYGLDSNGFIVSDVCLDNIDNVYKPCIQESVNHLRDLFPQQLHSVYLYGSVARGDAQIFKSDLDLIAMFDSSLDSTKLAELKKLASKLTDKYRSLVRDVGIAVAYYDYTFDPKNYYENAFLKEICVCVHGEDVGEQFGPYKLTPEIAISFNGDIHKSLVRTLNRLDTATDEDFKVITQGFCRKLIRTYYSMVMLRSQIWTTRLHEQSEVVIQHLPYKKPVINTLIKWIDCPPLDCAAVYQLFKIEGEWASSNFIREANLSL